MKILSKIQRDGGTHVTMDGIAYHFAPIDPSEPKSPHVADVTEKAHISRFMSVAEGFEYFGDNGPDPVREPIEDIVSDKPEDPDELDANEQKDTTEQEEALQRVLNAPEAAAREDAETAFSFLYERAPNSKSKTSTIVKKIIEKAAQDGWLADGDDASLIERLTPEAAT